jgi:hypothetical protein
MFCALGAVGCGLFRPPPGPNWSTAAGEIRMDWTSARNLNVLAHDWRRDRQGRLVVNVRLENVDGEPYAASVRVLFFDAAGEPVASADPRAMRMEFAPCRIALEWTSRTGAAEAYRVEIRSATFFQW